MILNQIDYIEKIKGCWNGKNIGGTLGAPFECLRGTFDITGYVQEMKGDPFPNDDLDIQLVWLNAAEKYGKNVNSKILGEYWLNYITPHWGEYGAGKNNLRAGIVPPLSGSVNNIYKNSCGCFILSEIWACLSPGHPEIAVKYAYEDGSVNHAEEGLFAEIFCAAVESAAFVESNIRKLIDIGLSYIPIDCGVAKGINNVIESFDKGLDWKQARKILLQTVPGSFGALGTPKMNIAEDEPVGEIGWDAPSNIGIIIVGLLYGESDFEKSLYISAGCGEDADCTAGTVGSILGIIFGESGIPESLSKPLGGKIKTLCINRADLGLNIPKSTDELSMRIARLLPMFMGPDLCNVITETNGYEITTTDADRMKCSPVPVNAWYSDYFIDKLKSSQWTTEYDFVIYEARLSYDGEPYIGPGQSRKFTLTIRNNILMQQWINIKWYLPNNWTISPNRQMSFSLEQFYCNIGIQKIEFVITASEEIDASNEVLISISSVGHHSHGVVPIKLFTRCE